MPQSRFDKAYAALAQLAMDTRKEVGSVLCRVIEGVDVSFTRTKSSYLTFGVVTQHEGVQQLNLYNAATYIVSSSHPQLTAEQLASKDHNHSGVRATPAQRTTLNYCQSCHDWFLPHN